MDFTTWTLPVGVTTDLAIVFFFGMFTGASVRLIRAALRWFKRAGVDTQD